MNFKISLRSIVIVVAFVLSSLVVCGAMAQDSSEISFDSRKTFRTGSEEAPLVVWNRPVTVFRTARKERTPIMRMKSTAERIHDLPTAGSDWKVDVRKVSNDGQESMALTYRGQWLFGLYPGDVDPESGETLAGIAQKAASQLEVVLKARAEQSDMTVLFRAIGLASLYILFFLAAYGLLFWSRRQLIKGIETSVERMNSLEIGKRKSLWRLLYRVKISIIKAVSVVIFITLIYLLVTYVLVLFPYTKPWGIQLGSLLWQRALDLLTESLAKLPNLFTLLIIFLVARTASGIVSGLFVEVEQGKIHLWSLDTQTARSTRHLLIFLIWVLAVMVAYPYIPGSNTSVFKGVSVFLGLMISLGSTSVFNQVLAGMTLVYSRAFKVGEYIRIGEVEGTVTEMGVLATKIETVQREELTIPHATLLTSEVKNYSRLAAGKGVIVCVSVTIGYDTPWRQVQGLLISAAEKAEGVQKEPPPYVLQKSLSDFYVEYRLCVPITDVASRVKIISALNANILDAFNEFGVQIMSPHFETQPDNEVVVPKKEWFKPPLPREDE